MLNVSHLRVAVYQIPPWIYINYDNSGSINRVWGPMNNVIEAISKASNFTYEYVNPRERVHGRPDINGTWNGLLGSVQRGEAEMIGDPTVPVYRRLLDFGLTHPFAYSPMKILSTPFPIQVSGELSFTQAFETEVWILLLGSLLVLGIINYLNESLITDIVLSENWALRVARNSVTFLTKLMGQGDSSDLGQVGRLLTGVWMLAMIVLMNFFGSAMIAALSTQKAFDTIDNLEDILRYKKLQPTILESSAYSSFFQNSPQIIHKKIFTRALELKSLVSIKRLFSKERLDSLLERKSVFIFDDHSMRVQLSAACTSGGLFHFSHGTLSELPMGLAFRKDMPNSFSENVNRKLLSILESGLSDFWLYRETARIARCLPQKGQENVPMAVKLSDLFAAFILLSRGLALGFGLLIIEILREKLLEVRLKQAIHAIKVKDKTKHLYKP